jgi:transcriptional regulator with XRE-family HTH domain
MAAMKTYDKVRETGLRLDSVALRRQMALRGLAGSDLAALARVSAPTITAALAGRSLSPRSARRIAQALVNAPVVLPAELLAS